MYSKDKIEITLCKRTSPPFFKGELYKLYYDEPNSCYAVTMNEYYGARFYFDRNKFFIWDYFLTQKEMRKLKLKNLK